MQSSEKWLSLNGLERIVFMEKIIHAARVDSEVFDKCQELIDSTKEKGLFNGVKFINEYDEIGRDD